MKKEPILICLYAYYPFANANTNVILPLINKLAEKYEVHILTKNNNNTALPYEMMSEDIHVHRYPNSHGFIKMIHSLAGMDIKKKRKWYKSIIVHTITPICRTLSRIPVLKKAEQKLMLNLNKTFKFKFIITTCESFSSHENMLYVKKHMGLKCPWIAYFMDPYAKFISNTATYGELLEKEIEVYKECDLALVTEEIYLENQTNEFSQFLYKTKPFKFGNFRCIDKPLINDIFIKDKINCVYVGSLLNESVRNPYYFYKIIDEVDDRFVFHIVCNNLTLDNKKLYNKTVMKKDRVHWYHNLPLEECLGIMCNADILINLGNKTINQTPSKIFDYIGTGNPIVNFYSLKDDTSKRYLKDYDNVVNIYEEQEKIKDNGEIFQAFAINNNGKKIETEILKTRYRDYQSDLVTEETIRIISSYVNN